MTTNKKNKRMGMDEIIQAMITDKRLRLNIVKRSHYFFFHYYFMGDDPDAEYYPLAKFHREMIHFTEDPKVTMLVIAGFRGSGKSTIMATSFPLWAILGEQKVKYVLIISQTEAKAQMMLGLIRCVLENNELIKKDVGKPKQEPGPWNSTSLFLEKYNAKITAVSIEQSIRSFRHTSHRPQLVICDDLEDLESVKTFEQREKLHEHFLSDIIPATAEKARIVILGGILNEDSIIPRLGKSIKEGAMDGQYCEYPFLDKNNKPLWIEKFKTPADIEREKRKAGDERVFQREHMLNPLTNKERIIKSEWIKEYDIMPSFSRSDYRGTFISIDPAGSKGRNSDSTAIITASVFGDGENMKIYIHPNPINEKLDFGEIKDRTVMLNKTIGGSYPATIIVEEAGVQSWLGDDFINIYGLRVERFKVGSVDKETRLKFAAPALQAGKVFLPKDQSKELQDQIKNFKFMKHDDLVDAFSMLIITVMRMQSVYHPFIENEKSQRPEKGEESDFEMNRDIGNGTDRPITAGLMKMKF